MKYNFNGKMVTIPDVEIDKAMKNLELTKDEAIEMWLEDNDYLENDEQIALDNKAKEVKIKKGTNGNKVGQSKPREVKVSDEKKELFSEIYDYLCETVAETGRNVQILKENKLISVQIGEKTFKVDIIEQRKPKK